MIRPGKPGQSWCRLTSGQWRAGSAGRELIDTDPWSGEVLTRIPLASADDVNEEDNTAYGGEKLTGLGRFGGNWSLDEFTTQPPAPAWNFCIKWNFRTSGACFRST
jgi:acyl-CoA reductase-like NAD-dependent aldehyde dehydrogenase